MIRRQCTSDYKIVPIRRKVRELLGLTGRRSPDHPVVEQWLGISFDWSSAPPPTGAVAESTRVAERLKPRRLLRPYIKGVLRDLGGIAGPVSSGLNAGFALVANVEDAFGRALGQECLAKIVVEADLNVEMVSRLLRTSKRRSHIRSREWSCYLLVRCQRSRAG